MKLFSILNVAFALAAPPTGGSGPVFHGSFSRIDAITRAEMIGSSWHQGCPVAIADLRLLRMDYLGFDDLVHRGRLIVHEAEARPIRRVFRTLFYARYPIRRMRLVDAYGGSDDRSMAADNTSAFNCRPVEGTSRWSEHAYGRAIDINPVENPFVSGTHVSPPRGRAYADRARRAPGMIHAGDAVVRAFAAVGWCWGGNWNSPTDYQHFSASGR
jgi:hypothetical protein